MNRFLNCSVAGAAVAAVVLGTAPLTSARVVFPVESSADATHPRVMERTARDLEHAGPATPGAYGARSATVGNASPVSATIPPLQREIFGCAFGNASLNDPTYGYPAWSFNLLTTIAYFGLSIDWDGTIIQNGSGWTTWNSSALTGLIATAHANRDRVIVSVNLHNFTTDPSSTMCAALHPTHRAVTVSQIVAQIYKMNADGVNLDYEGDNTTCAYQVVTTQYGPDLQYEVTRLAAEF